MVLPRSDARLVSLFSGIAGFEVGLGEAGFSPSLLCEIDDGATAVLAAHFPGVTIHRDIRKLKSLSKCDILTAGFPCQDLSQAGKTAGIKGRNSGLVTHVFRSLRMARPDWVVLENVSFMLALDRGRAMRYLTMQLENLGYRWAYRVVDTRAFGLPQRRQRVILVASRRGNPCDVLFVDEEGPPVEPAGQAGRACGFYWTEGVRGLGWAWDAVPTLKGGSTIGIPSPPAIWMPTGEIVTPDIRDAERLQGFPPDWTAPAATVPGRRASHRWKLVGNAVSAPVFHWLGSRLLGPGDYRPSNDRKFDGVGKWPNAAWGSKGVVRIVERSMWPLRRERPPLAQFLEFPTKPLSAKATAGFLARTRTSSLHFPEGFLDAVEAHLSRVQPRLFARTG